MTRFLQKAFLATWLCFALALPAASQSGPKPGVFAAWSQIIGSTAVPFDDTLAPPRVQMRFAISLSESCDSFLLEATAARPGVSAVSVVPTLWADKPLRVKVCKADMDDGWITAQLHYKDATAVTLTSKINYGVVASDLTDPQPPAEPNWTPGPSDGKVVNVAGAAHIGQHDDLRMVTLADTGCRGHDGSSSRRIQDCDNVALPDSWPLASIAANAATLGDDKRAPDLVIHSGDYRYFLESSMYKDTWQLWRKDFFPAAQPLLLAAPWVFGRGNHEGCPQSSDLKYGVGYFQFFGTDLNPNCTSLTRDLMQPWYFDVTYNGASDDQAHRFVILDANSYYRGFPRDQMEENFRIAKAITDVGPVSSWWVWHSPGADLLHYKSRGASHASDHFGDRTVLDALVHATGKSTPVENRFCGLSGSKPCRPAQFLMGHQHLFQDITFSNDKDRWIFPRQYVIGHGGVNMDGGNPARYGSACHDNDFPIGADYKGTKGQVQTLERHGAIFWQRSDKTLGLFAGWENQFAWAAAQTGLPGTTPQSPTYSSECK